MITAAGATVATQLLLTLGKTALQGLEDRRGGDVVIAAEELAFLPCYLLPLLAGFRGVAAIVIGLGLADLVVAVEAWRRVSRRVGWRRLGLARGDAGWWGATESCPRPADRVVRTARSGRWVHHAAQPAPGLRDPRCDGRSRGTGQLRRRLEVRGTPPAAGDCSDLGVLPTARQTRRERSCLGRAPDDPADADRHPRRRRPDLSADVASDASAVRRAVRPGGRARAGAAGRDAARGGIRSRQWLLVRTRDPRPGLLWCSAPAWSSRWFSTCS